VSGADDWEVGRRDPLLDLDFDAEEPEPIADPTPLHRRVYEQWWGRPWPVFRETEDPEIPALRDIAKYKRTA
jgi:hypothetical protein